MTPTTRHSTIRIPDELLEAMQKLKDRDGIPLAEQIRRGLLLYLEARGVTVTKKTGRERAGTRRRP